MRARSATATPFTWALGLLLPLCSLSTGALPLLPGLASRAHAQGRAGSETEEEIVFKKAEEQFNAGNYADAADLFDQAIKLNPARVEAFVKRATLYFRERKFAQAIDLLQRAEKLSYSDVTVKTVLGLCLYETGEKDRGLSYLEDVVKQRPDTYDAQFQIGKHYARLDPERAERALESYFRYRPDDKRSLDPSAHLLLGTAYYLHGQLPEARKALEDAESERQREGQSKAALENQIKQTLGTVLIAQGEWAAGAALYEPLLPDVQRRPAVAFNLATCYLNLGRRDEARKLARQYQALRKDDPRALTLLASIERAGGQESDARSALGRYQEAQESLAKSPEAAKDWASRVNIAAGIARAHLQLRDAAKAASTAEAGLAELREGKYGRHEGGHDEIELTALLIEARILQMNQSRTPPGPGAPANLLTLGERLAQLAPSDAPALALAGSAAYASGSFERARKFYQDARAIDVKLPRARIGLARTLEQLAIAGIVAAPEETTPPAPVKEREKDRDRDRDKDKDAQPRLSERAQALVSAVTLLREARTLDDSPSLARNLAAVQLMQNQSVESERTLSTAFGGLGKNDPTLWRLQSRTQQQLGRGGAAQEAAERAVTEAKKQLDAVPVADAGRRALATQRLAEARIELAARLLGSGATGAPGTGAGNERERLDRAVETLEGATRDLASQPSAGAETKEVLRAGQRDLALAYLRRGRGRLAESETQIGKSGLTAATTKLAEDALADLQKSIESGMLDTGASGTHEAGYAQCLGAMAATEAGQFKVARDLLAKAKDTGCELVPPYNRLGTELLSLFIQYRTATAPAQREQLLRAIPKLQGKAGSGPDSATLQKVLRSLLFSANMALAYDYHQLGRTKLVTQALRSAQKAQTRETSADEDAVLEHNLAVMDLVEGRGGGEKVLERLGVHPPEALVNLGILHDRRGEARKALELYRRALERGARTPKLREWIDTKDRLLGQGGQQ